MNNTQTLYLADALIKRAGHAARDTASGIVGAEAGGLGGLVAGGMAGSAYASYLDPVSKGLTTLRRMNPNPVLDEMNLPALVRKIQLTGRGGMLGAVLGTLGGSAGAIALARHTDRDPVTSKLQQALDVVKSRQH